MAQVEYSDLEDDKKMIIVDSESNRQRSCTDLAHLFIFLILFALWAGIAIYAYSSSISFFDVVSRSDYEKNVELLQAALYVGRFVTLSFIWLSILFLGFYFILISWLPKCTIYFTTFLVSFLSILSLLTTLATSPIPLLLLLLSGISILIIGVIIYTWIKVGSDVVCKVIKDSLRAMLNFPLASILIVIIQGFLNLLIIFSNASIIFYLFAPYLKEATSHYNQHQSQSTPPGSAIILALINVCYTIWMIKFVSHVGRAILHGNFVVWYQSENKKAVSTAAVFRQMKNTLRYHLGTLAFGSTIFTKYQVLRAIFSSNTVYSKTVCRNPITFLCFLIVLAHTTVNALIISVIFGKNSYTATKESLDLLTTNHLKFVAVNGITRWIIAFGIFIIPMLPLGFAALYFYSQQQYYQPIIVVSVLVLIGVFNLAVTATFLVIFDNAIQAILFCYLYEANANEKKVKIENQIVSQDQHDMYKTI